MTILNYKTKVALMFCTSSFAVTVGGVGFAQNSPVKQITEERVGLEEIVVTAQKRSELINQVSMSITAASGEQLVARGISTPADLDKIVPGFTATVTPYGNPVYVLRGVGFYESSLAGSSPVAIYIDEIPLPYSAMALGASFDLQRVEVLKGPQGTLYGQNSTGGAINYIANKPTDSFKSGVDLSYGRFNDVETSAFISGPVTDTLSIRLAAGSAQSAGWQKSVTRANDSNGAKNLLKGRLLVDFHPNEKLKFELSVNGYYDRSDTQAVQMTSFAPNFPALATAPELALPSTPLNARSADWTPGRNLAKDNHFYQVALKANYLVSEEISLTSITSFQRYDVNQATDADGTYLQLADVTQIGKIESFSQELRVQGTVSRLNWVAGLNYSHDKIDDRNDLIVADATNARSFPPFIINSAKTISTQTATTKAIFGNIGYEVFKDVTLEAGARYTQQDRSFSGCLGDAGDGIWAATFTAYSPYLYIHPVTILPNECTTILPTGLPGMYSDNLNQHNVSWRTGVKWQVNTDTMLYANVSKGYKSGSFGTLGATIYTQYQPASQESLLAYEAGTKITLLDHKLHVNASAFYYDYRDKQLRGKVLDIAFGSIEKLINVQKSRIVGVELQVIAAPTQNLTFDATMSFSDSKILSHVNSFTPIGTPVDFYGESFELTPKWQMAGGMTYDTSINNIINVFAGVDVTYKSSAHGGYGKLPIFKIDPYAIVDARMGIRRSDDSWKISVWIKNLTDKYYWTNSNYLGDTTYRQTGMPRTYGLMLNYRY